MKRRLLILLATLALAVTAAAPGTALAATGQIDQVHLWLTPPLSGKAVFTSNDATVEPAGQCQVDSVKWYKADTYAEVPSSASFQAGTKYYAVVSLQPKDGWEFKYTDAQGVHQAFSELTIDGQEALADWVESRVYTPNMCEIRTVAIEAKTAISDVQVSGFANAVVGEQPQAFGPSDQSPLTVPTGAPYAAIAEGWWYHVNGMAPQAATPVLKDGYNYEWGDRPFVAGGEYFAQICLEAAPGYTFDYWSRPSYSIRTTVNGNAALVDPSASYVTDRGSCCIVATPTTVAGDTKFVRDVSLAGVGTPVVGQKPVTADLVAFPKSARYRVKSVEWVCAPIDDPTARFVDPSFTTVFKRGYLYQAEIQLQLDEGSLYAFDATQFPSSQVFDSITVDGKAIEPDNIMVTGPKSMSLSTSQVAAQLPAPKTLTAKLYGYDDVALKWSAVSGAAEYRVYRSKSGSAYKYVKTVKGTSCKLANLADGVKYGFRVRAVDASGGTKTAGVAKSAGVWTLKKLATPTVTKYAAGKAKVSWKNISGETGYQISQSATKSGTTVAATYATTSGKSKVVKATKGKRLYYKVRAYKVVDGKRVYAPWSAPRAFTVR